MRLPLTKPRAHFIHVGKTAGTAIRGAIQPYAKQGSYRIDLHRHHTHTVTLPDVPAGDKFFFVVRDPAGRFVSGFNSRLRRGQPRYDVPWSPCEAEAFGMFSSANALAEALSSSDAGLQDAASRAMSCIEHVKDSYRRWFVSPDYFRGRLDDLLLVARQERLDEDFRRLVSLLGLPETVRLPEEDVLAHRTPSDLDRHLTDLARENLRGWYADDYEFLAFLGSLASTQTQSVG